MLRSTPFAHVAERMPNKLLICFDQLLGIPISHDCFWSATTCRRFQSADMSGALLKIIHPLFAPELVFRQMQRLRSKRAAADIFARGLLLTLVSPPAAADHSRSTQVRRQFSIGIAMRRRTLWRALRVFCHVDLCPSI